MRRGVKALLYRLRHSLYWRALLFTAIGAGCLLGAVAVQSYLMVRSSVDRLLKDRLDLARITGTYLEHRIHADLARVEQAIGGTRDVGALRKQLSNIASMTLFGEGLFTLGPTGVFEASAPEVLALQVVDQDLRTLTQEVLRHRKPAISSLLTLPPGQRKILIVLAPISYRGRIERIVGGVLHPAVINLLEWFHGSDSPSTTIQLVDVHGNTVASSRPKLLYSVADHGRVLASAIHKRAPVQGRCHGCHTTDGNPRVASREDEVLAFAPLPSLRLGVAVRQLEIDALAPAFGLRRRMGLLGVSFLVLFLFFASLSISSVITPIRRLTQAVRTTEEQSHQASLPTFGRDEIGQLARALERWRRQVISSLQAAKETDSRRKQSQEYLHHVLLAQEDERRRIARELHDTIAQDLAAHRLKLERLGRQSSDDLTADLLGAEAQAHEMLVSLRHLLVDLRPSVLDSMGLVSAVQWHLERVHKDHGIRARLSVEGVPDGQAIDLAPEPTLTLFRIVQECLQNVVLHARAQNVLVTLAAKNHEITLSVEDDGVGFDVAALKARDPTSEHGLGLLGIEERAQLLGGSATFESEPGCGSTISVTIPCTARDARSPSC